MARKSVLGDTLDSIFDDFDGIGGIGNLGNFSDDSPSGGLQTLKIGDIEPNRDQPRKDFDGEKLELLADSLRQHGVIQPLTVRQLDNGAFQIVAGERRWRAARIAGLTEVPVRIMELTDEQTMQIALIENLQREDLNPIEEANGYQELIDNYNMTQEELAGVVGRPRSTVANSLRLLTLPEQVLELVQKNLLSKGHCKAIMSATSTATMISLAKQAAAGELSVRETERLARLTKGEPVKTQSAPTKNTFFKETELALSEALNTTVRITDGKNKKTLCIDFTDEEDLKEIINKF